MTAARRAVSPAEHREIKMTEAQLLENVRDAVKKLDPDGYLYHTHDSRRSAAGFPDLAIFLPRYRVGIFRELKTERGRCSRQQIKAGCAMAACGIDVAVWTPRDWFSGRIIRELTGGAIDQEVAS